MRTATDVFAALMQTTSTDELPNLGELFQRPAWYAEAACRPPGVAGAVFFPERGQTPRRAKQVCQTCPVRVECLQTALEDTTLVGIWGGTTDKERARIRKAAGTRNDPR